MENNRVYNCKNPNQGKFKRVLAVCSAGLLRSPTVAWILSNNPWHFNTRAAGLDQGHALIWADDVLLEWADEIVCMANPWAPMPQAAIDYVKSWPEFNAKMFKEITGLD